MLYTVEYSVARRSRAYELEADDARQALDWAEEQRVAVATYFVRTGLHYVGLDRSARKVSFQYRAKDIPKIARGMQIAVRAVHVTPEAM